MGLNVRVPLPGPVSYTVSTRRRSSGYGLVFVMIAVSVLFVFGILTTIPWSVYLIDTAFIEGSMMVLGGLVAVPFVIGRSVKRKHQSK